MTREAELFALARSAFRAALPSDDDSRAVARRLEPRLRERTRRRRFTPLLAVAFALLGALAYAAEAARASRATPEPNQPAPLETPAHAAPHAAAPTAAPVPANAPAPAAALTAPATRTTPLTPTRPAKEGARPARPPATWAAVARSLARGDERTARLSLERLSANGSARDRANAAVELARLSAHRGDCSRAGKHLEYARALLGSSPSLARAADAVSRCESSAAPAGARIKD